MTINSDGTGTESTQSVIYVSPRVLHDSGLLDELRMDAAGYERQLDAGSRSSGSELTPIDALRQVVDEFETRQLETLTPVIQELERRNERFQHTELVQRRKRAIDALLGQIREAFEEVATKIEMDVAEFERQCVDPVTVVIELPEEVRDALRCELKRFYRTHAEGNRGNLPERPSLQTLINYCMQVLQRSAVE